MLSKDLSIKHKLTWAILLTSGIALTLAGTALVGYDMVTYRATLVRSLSILTDVVRSRGKNPLLGIHTPLVEFV